MHALWSAGSPGKKLPETIPEIFINSGGTSSVGRRVIKHAGNIKKKFGGERGKRDVDCDKQVEKAVTAPNCVLKGSWGEGGSGGIRKKLKSEYAAYLESNFKRNDGNSI